MISLALNHIVPAALQVLPRALTSPEATAMLLAIGLQESKFLHRRQEVLGPARGFWQFERSGVSGVVTHPKTRGPLSMALTELRYAHAIGNALELHQIVEHNDIVACVCARLLLYTLPARLPARDDPGAGYGQYIAAWRPGKPHPATWDAYFVEAWHRVDQREGPDA